MSGEIEDAIAEHRRQMKYKLDREYEDATAPFPCTECGTLINLATWRHRRPSGRWCNG